MNKEGRRTKVVHLSDMNHPARQIAFSAFAQEASEEKPKEQENTTPAPEEPIGTPHQLLNSAEQSKEIKPSGNKYDFKERFISHDEKPPIFGSHAYNPITQEFETVVACGSNGTAAFDSNAGHKHGPLTATTVADVDNSGKDLGRIGRYRAAKKLSSQTEGTQGTQLNSTGIGFGIFNDRTMQLIQALNSSLPVLPMRAPIDPINDKLNQV